jgi:hypothetical protein
MGNAEVGHLPGVVPDGLDHEHRVGQAVQQGEDRRLRLRGRQVTVGEPGRHHPCAARRQGRQMLADLGGECGERPRPDGFHHPEQLTVPLAQGEDHPGPGGRSDDRRVVAGRPAGGPPQVSGAASDPLSRAVKLGRDTLPAVGLADRQARLAEQLQSPVHFEQPERDRGRPERDQHLPGQHGDELGAVGGQLGRRLDHQ